MALLATKLGARGMHHGNTIVHRFSLGPTCGLTGRCRGRLHQCTRRQRQAGAPELGR